MRKATRKELKDGALDIAKKLLDPGTPLGKLCSVLRIETTDRAGLRPGADDFGAAWAALGKVKGGATSIHVGFDYAKYRYRRTTKDFTAVSEDRIVPEVCAVIGREKGLGHERQFDDVVYALREVLGVDVDEAEYPNLEPRENMIVVWRNKRGSGSEDPGLRDADTHILIGLRGESFEWSSIADAKAALVFSEDRIKKFIEAVHVALGALNRKPKDMREIVIGWCGEVAAFHCLKEEKKEPCWSEDWRRPYDIRCGDLHVEVKTTGVDSMSDFTLSPTELQMAAGKYRLILVRWKNEEVVRQILSSLKVLGAGDDQCHQDESVGRLSGATGIDAVSLFKRLTENEVLKALRNRENFSILSDDSNPSVWLGEDAIKKLASRRASLTLPFSPRSDAG